MRFLVEFDVAPDDPAMVVTPEQMLEHLRAYVFDPTVGMEMSLIPGDPYHDKGDGPGDYVSFFFTGVTVSPVE